jgi:hypothetical protein
MTMPALDNNAFAREFVDFLKRTDFPAGLSAADTMFRCNLMVLGFATQVYGQVGRQYTVTDLASTGIRGGGGGPHLEAIFAYLGGVNLAPVATALRDGGLGGV